MRDNRKEVEVTIYGRKHAGRIIARLKNLPPIMPKYQVYIFNVDGTDLHGWFHEDELTELDDGRPSEFFR